MNWSLLDPSTLVHYDLVKLAKPWSSTLLFTTRGQTQSPLLINTWYLLEIKKRKIQFKIKKEHKTHTKSSLFYVFYVRCKKKLVIQNCFILNFFFTSAQKCVCFHENLQAYKGVNIFLCLLLLFLYWKVLPCSQNVSHISFVLSQTFLSLTKFIEKNINI